jgi:hypothetical protein
VTTYPKSTRATENAPGIRVYKMTESERNVMKMAFGFFALFHFAAPVAAAAMAPKRIRLPVFLAAHYGLSPLVRKLLSGNSVQMLGAVVKLDIDKVESGQMTWDEAFEAIIPTHWIRAMVPAEWLSDYAKGRIVTEHKQRQASFVAFGDVDV